MKRTWLAIVLISAVLAPFATVTAAERGHGARDYRAGQTRDTHYRDNRAPNYRDQRAAPARPAVRPHGRPAARSYAPPRRYAGPRYNPPRGYRHQEWRRGHYLPSHYRAAPYVVDYRAWRLAPPPRGYHYVQVDDRAVLVAITTGLIAEVLNDAFYR